MRGRRRTVHVLALGDSGCTVGSVLISDPVHVRHAAEVAARLLGLGTPVLVRRSSAASFVAGDGFLRVVGGGDDPAGTLAVAQVVADTVGGARPLADAPLEVDCGEVRLFVEPYERLTVDGSGPVSFHDQGVQLAALHAVDVSGSVLRPLRRVDACLERLAGAPEWVQRRLAPHVAQMGDAVVTSASRVGLCHGDPARDNLVSTPAGFVWVDFEYAGVGPVSFDVAFCIVELLRFRGPEAARAFAAGYHAGGGQIDMVDVVRLGGARDVCGVVDYSYQSDPAHQAEFARRLASFDEPFRQTSWGSV